MKGSFPRAFLAFLLAASPAPAVAQAYSGLGAGSVPPEVVAKYAAPPLDPAVSRRIQTMLDVRAPGLGIVAPDGSRLYFGWRITGTPQVFRLNGPKGFPVQMTGGEDRTTVEAVTPDGKWLVLSRDVGGEENPGLYLQPADGGAAQDDPEDREGPDVLRLRHGRRQGASTSTRTTSRRTATRSTATTSRRATKTLVFGEKGLWTSRTTPGRARTCASSS